MKSLDDIPEVVEADMLVGNFEIICKTVAPTYNDISEIINYLPSAVDLNIVYLDGGNCISRNDLELYIGEKNFKKVLDFEKQVQKMMEARLYNLKQEFKKL